MKKKVKTVCQIIRFRGKIEAFLVSIDLFDIPRLQAVAQATGHTLFTRTKILTHDT